VPGYVSEIIKIKALKIPLLCLISIGVIYLIPQNAVTFGLICLIIVLFTADKPKLALYISIAIITFKYYFAYTNVIGVDFYIPFWKFVNPESFFVKNSHNFVFVYLVIVILKNVKNCPEYVRGIIKSFFVLIIILLIVIIISALLNLVSPIIVILFIVQLIRPILFFILVIIIPWNKNDLFKFFVFVFTLIFPVQIILSLIDNWQIVLGGHVLLGDLFAGSFTFPFNPVTVQVLFYSFCIIFIDYIKNRSKKSFIMLLVVLFSIGSAQSGLQTIVILFSLLPFFLMVLLNPESINVKSLQTKFLIFIFLINFIFLLFIVLSNPEMPGYDIVVEYNESSTERVMKEGIMETPKIRTYEILFNYWASGKINPILGLGPGNYLSGASMYQESEYIKLFLGNTNIFKSGMFSNMLSYPQNDFVGLSGEIGIPGYILVLLLYIFPIRIIMKNKYYYFISSFWSTVYAGMLGIFLCVIGWSFFWNIFEEWAMPVYYFVIAGILVSIKANDLIDMEE
jgi:hypothetical protein